MTSQDTSRHGTNEFIELGQGRGGKRWFGLPPGQYRRRLKREEVGAAA